MNSLKTDDDSLVIPEFDTHHDVRQALHDSVQSMLEGDIDENAAKTIIQACKAATTSLQAEKDQKTAEQGNARVAAMAANIDADDEAELRALLERSEEHGK